MEGFLRTSGGQQVLSTDRKPIRVAAGTLESDVGIDEGGGITVKGARVAELLVVGFANESGLQKTEGALLSATEQSGQPATIAGEFVSGVLEGSNVSAVEGMVDIVKATRAFEACQRVIDAFRDAGRRSSSIITPR
jgi:flagellar basal body rod protein FlgG